MARQPLSLREMLEIRRIARGTLTPIKKTQTGKVFYCLQYGRKGKHVSKYIPAEELEAYREATENYRLFMEAVDRHVEELTAATAAEIRKEAMACRGKSLSRSASRSSRQDASTCARRSPRNG